MAIANTLKKYLHNAGVHFSLIPQEKLLSGNGSGLEPDDELENIAKAIVLKEDKDLLLAVIPASRELKLSRFRKRFKRYVSFADENDYRHLFTDCISGAVPAVGKAYGVEVVFDDHLNDCLDIYFEAGNKEDLVHVSGKDFRGLLGSVQHGDISQEI